MSELAEEWQDAIEVFQEGKRGSCVCGARLVPHIEHRVAEPINWTSAVGLECEDRCGFGLTMEDLMGAALAQVKEIERLRRELDSVVDIAAAALDHVRKRYNGDSDSFGDIEEALLDAGFTMDDLDASPGLGQAREDVLSLLDGARGSVMDRRQDEDDFIPPELVDTACPVCDEPRLWCWCDDEKGGDGNE